MAVKLLEVTKKVAFIPMVKVQACNRLIKHTFKKTHFQKKIPENMVSHRILLVILLLIS